MEERNKACHGHGNQHNIFAAVAGEEMQAFTQGNYSRHYGSKGNWWLYAYSDRPAYRPDEKVSFKGILRKNDGLLLLQLKECKLKQRFMIREGMLPGKLLMF